MFSDQYLDIYDINSYLSQTRINVCHLSLHC